MVREGVDYLEGFPAFEMVEAGRALNRPRRVIWYDKGREEVGSGEVSWEGYRMSLLYRFSGLETDPPVANRRILPVEPVQRGSHSYRFHVICRTCGKYVYRLFFRTSDWLCKDCQCLRNRATFLSPQQRWQEEFDGLRWEIGEGRPFGMREREYARKRMRMAALRPKLNGSGRRPGPEYFRLVFAEWSDKDPKA